MKELRILLGLLIVLTTQTELFSQSRFNIHVGPAFPVSKIDMYTVNYSDVYTVSASAKTGINVGLQYSYQFPNRGTWNDTTSYKQFDEVSHKTRNGEHPLC